MALLVAASTFGTSIIAARRPRGGRLTQLVFVLLAAFAVALPALNANAQVNDSFSRPDGADLGNGWIEKNPQAFSLAGGAAVKQAVGDGYRDNIVYRPAGEDLLNVEVAAELELSSPVPGYPQIFARVQSSTVAFSGRIDGYILYVNNNPNEAILGRQRGDAFVESLATVVIAPGLNVGDTYRLRLRATGANPVQLAAYVERWTGSDWVIDGQATANDASGAAITTAGSIGFGGFVEAAYSFDNVSATDLGGASNPVPTLGSLNPTSATEGGSAFSLTVNGSDFVPGSIVRWNGADRATTYVSPGELQAAVTAADIATAGTASVTVFSPAPGGGTSAVQTFTIDPLIADNPVPTTTSLNPNSATEGGSAFSLTVNGSDFIPGSVVRWNGADRTTTYISANELQAAITAADIAAAGSASVTVFNPAPGGGISAAQTFTIDSVVANNPVPNLGSINPTSATEGGSAFSLTVNGGNFIPGSVVRWNGSDRTTTYVSANELEAAITAADIAAAGSASVTVFSPAPGGGTSGAQTFTIDPLNADNPLPVLSSLAPSSAIEGGSAFSLTVNGSGFIPGSVVRWNGGDRATTFVSANELQAAITAADIATAGSDAVTVFNPAPGGGTSAAQTFTTQAGTPGAGDTFSRPDGADLGNGWIEKNPQAFALQGGAAVKQAVAEGYRDNIVYRPAGEDLLNVEVSAELELSSPVPGYPQIFARVQSNTVALSNRIDGYILYVNNNANEAILGRQRGDAFVEALATVVIAPGLSVGETYRFRLSATGANPVQLAAYVERWTGSNWVIEGQTTASDASGAALTTAGSVGFGGFVEAAYSFDNFLATDLGGGGNPLPALGSLSPTSATEGGSAFSLTVNGSNFVPGSIVRWNGADRTTTHVSANELQAAVTAGDIAAAGSASVTVFSPAPGGGTSGAQTFTIDPLGGGNPVPVLTSLNPTSATEGGSAFSLTVNGSDFVPGSVVRWNGGDRATTYVSANQLQAAITAADIAAAGSASVTVFSPAPGGGTSAVQNFTIDPLGGGNNPVPVLNTLNPTSATEGGSAFSLTVNGSDFVADSIVRWNGNDRTTTFVSANELQAAITAADIAAAGSASVTVFSPAPGGGTSAAENFTIDAINPGGGGPFVASLSPESVTAGSGDLTVTIVGSGFDAQSVGNWNGNPRPTVFLSNQAIEVTLSAADLASADVGTVTVVDTAPQGGGSTPHPFFVLEANSTYFFDNFNAPDSADLGNGWTEKTPEVFSIVNNAVRSIWFDRIYRDSIAYRPVAEDRLDVEISAEFVRQPAGQYTQLHARVQRDTIAAPDFLESYIFYIEDNVASGAVAFAINPPIVSMGECIIDQIDLPSPLQVGQRYRMRFFVTGTDTVRLEGRVDRFVNGAWDSWFQAVIFHDDNTQRQGWYCPVGYMPAPIRQAGSNGFSKWVDQADDYDNYYWIDLSGTSAVPTVSSVAPDAVTAGDPGFTLIVDGGNFAPTSTVRWNGNDRPTTYVDSTTLQAAISAADIAAEGVAQVTVATPAPGGGVSNAANVTIAAPGQLPNPTPAVSSFSPATFSAGQPATLLTVTGTGFVPESVLRWNGVDLTTTFLSETSLSATIPATDLAAPGSAAVTVSNPAPGGGLSEISSIAILATGELLDDFERTDGATLQNGWTEKNPAAFSIGGGRLVKNQVGDGYRDNVAYRPVGESRQDVETSIEFQLNDPVPGYPQIFARLQAATVDAASTIDGYILYINNGNSAVLGRQNGSSFVTALVTIPLSEAMTVGSTYRLRLSATGAGTVTVSGAVERLSESGFVDIGSASVDDASPDRIAGAGMSGVGGHVEDSYTYDNFRDGPSN